jgi:hypothetical protein
MRDLALLFMGAFISELFRMLREERAKRLG